jgi:hypothetical protein
VRTTPPNCSCDSWWHVALCPLRNSNRSWSAESGVNTLGFVLFVVFVDDRRTRLVKDTSCTPDVCLVHGTQSSSRAYNGPVAHLASVCRANICRRVCCTPFGFHWCLALPSTSWRPYLPAPLGCGVARSPSPVDVEYIWRACSALLIVVAAERAIIDRCCSCCPSSYRTVRMPRPKCTVPEINWLSRASVASTFTRSGLRS